MTKRLFAVIRTHGAAWEASKSLEDQEDWVSHASFMNALHSEGLVVLGGPLEGTSDVLLVVSASNEREIIDRLSTDPWSSADLLRIARIAPWTVRLGSLATSGASPAPAGSRSTAPGRAS